MRRILILIGTVTGLFTCVELQAANLRLYMKDGTSEIVREYKVDGEKVSFYSVERSDWEDVPITLIDLKRTETEAASRKETIEKQAREITEEDAAARELQKEILKIPQDAGVYLLENDQLRIFKLADAYVHNNKGRNLLTHLSPVPLIPGKATLEIPEPHSLNVIKEQRPDLYIQLAVNGAQFGIVKLTPKGVLRVVEQITIMPVVKELVEERQSMQIFTKQLTDGGLYKIWPQEPLEKGEYAVIEYTEGKVEDARLWDFRIQP